METRINPNQVSHIKIKRLQKTKYFWIPEKTRSFLFGLFKSTIKEGYYYWNTVFEGEVVYFANEKCVDMVDIDGDLWYLPKVSIFCGEKLIKERYFNTFEEAKEYCNINFPNVNITL